MGQLQKILSESPEHGLRPRILVVEDEYIIAAEIAQALEEIGAEVIGPSPDIETALALIERGEHLDGAVLDMNLRGELVFPLADVLRTCGVPFVFATGYNRGAVPAIHRNVQRFEKPVNAMEVATGLLTKLQPTLMGASGQLWDWRRRIADLYHDVRADPDPQAAWRHWCATRAKLFRTHPQSPVEPDDRANFAGPAMFPYDPGLRLDVRLRGTAAEAFTLPAGTDGEAMLTAFACTEGLTDLLGGELTLYWIGGYGGGAFLPFADATSGQETYGGGRYLMDTIKGADLGIVAPYTRLVLDFNFAYAPSCVYSPRYICPLAPRGNRLPVRFGLASGCLGAIDLIISPSSGLVACHVFQVAIAA